MCVISFICVTKLNRVCLIVLFEKWRNPGSGKWNEFSRLSRLQRGRARGHGHGFLLLGSRGSHFVILFTWTLVLEDFIQTGRIVQLVKCLPPKHENLNFIFRSHVKTPGLVVNSCNLRAAEEETWRSLGLTSHLPEPNWWTPGLWETQSQKRCVLFRMTPEMVLWPSQAYAYMYIHAHAPPPTHRHMHLNTRGYTHQK